MAGLSLSQIRDTITKDEALTSLIGYLDALGFSATSWQSGSMQRTFLEGCAWAWASMSQVGAALSEFCFLDDADDDALTALASSHYDRTRVAATYTEGTCTLTAAVGVGPYVITAGQLVVADEINGYTYRNTTGGVLNGGATLDLTFRAEVAGAARNVSPYTGPGTGIATLNTPLAGVTVDNAVIAPATTWITSAGVDQETDATLRTRCSTRWSTLSYAAPEDAYLAFALDADAAITRVTVDDSLASTGVLTVYVAGSTGVVGAGPVANAQTTFDAKAPLTADVTAVAAAAQAQAFIADVYITTAYHTTAKETEIEQALEDYINSLPIGGETLGGLLAGHMLFSELTGAVTDVEGVVYVNWTTPTANVAIASGSVMTVTGPTLTFHSV